MPEINNGEELKNFFAAYPHVQKVYFAENGEHYVNAYPHPTEEGVSVARINFDGTPGPVIVGIITREEADREEADALSTAIPNEEDEEAAKKVLAALQEDEEQKQKDAEAEAEAARQAEAEAAAQAAADAAKSPD
jgi:hypothetical protein